jgi:hypothetical protein
MSAYILNMLHPWMPIHIGETIPVWILSEEPLYVTICRVPFTDEQIQIHTYIYFPASVYFMLFVKRTHRKLQQNKDRRNDRVLLNILSFFKAGHSCNNDVVNTPATSEYGHFIF